MFFYWRKSSSSGSTLLSLAHVGLRVQFPLLAVGLLLGLDVTGAPLSDLFHLVVKYPMRKREVTFPHNFGI